MTTTKKPKKKRADGKLDQRVNNGAVSRGLTEDGQLIKGPKDLIEAMRVRARADGQTISAAWRRAAELYLGRAA
jgi:hypothetical protein